MLAQAFYKANHRFNMRALVAPTVVAITILYLPSHGASARDRPGTPNHEKAYTCYDPLKDRPAVCVEFYNTASEPVRFGIEFTVNGTSIVDGARRPEAVCIDHGMNVPKSTGCGIGPCPGYWGPLYNCEAARHFKSGPASGPVARGRTAKDMAPTGTAVLPQGFKVVNLQYNTQYCFRFKARRVSDGVVSELWSNWACAKTGAAPPRPAMPSKVTASYDSGGRDWRTNPPKVTLKWEGDKDSTATYEIQKRLGQSGDLYSPKDLAASRGIPSNNKLEFVDVLSEREVEMGPPLYTLCAVNVSGRACVRDVSVFDGMAAKKPKVPIPSLIVPSFTGIWATTTGSGGKFRIELTQTNENVAGTYSGSNSSRSGPVTGTISGTAKGGKLTFRWKEGGREGTGVFVLAKDGKSFTGHYSTTADPNRVAAAWNGTLGDPGADYGQPVSAIGVVPKLDTLPKRPADKNLVRNPQR